MKIIETSDAFLSNLPPDSQERMDIDLEQIRARKPKIIDARGHGYGTKGGLAARGGSALAAYWVRGRHYQRVLDRRRQLSADSAAGVRRFLWGLCIADSIARARRVRVR
jgi:hypothetical protein